MVVPRTWQYLLLHCRLLWVCDFLQVWGTKLVSYYHLIMHTMAQESVYLSNSAETEFLWIPERQTSLLKTSATGRFFFIGWWYTSMMKVTNVIKICLTVLCFGSVVLYCIVLLCSTIFIWRTTGCSYFNDFKT